MPRDGSNIYHRPPGTDAVPDTTIESTKYNSNVADVEQDLNTPRPIVAGGTGASDAHTAMVNLGGEFASQVVTNYDSFPFVPGSFYSAAGATSAPVAGHAFTGICYHLPTNYQIVEARDLNDTVQPPRKYVRFNNGGTWGSWYVDGRTVIGVNEGIGCVNGDMFFGVSGTAPNSAFIVNDKADSTGHNIIQVAKGGGLTVNGLPGNGPNVTMNAPAAGLANVFYGLVVTKARWTLSVGDGTAETGSNAGSNFALSRFNDAGAFLGTALSVLRADGTVNVTGSLQCASSVWSYPTTTTGIYQFGNSGTKTLSYDGTNFVLSGGVLTTSSDVKSSGNLIANAGYVQAIASGAVTTGFYHFGNTGTKFLQYDGSNFALTGGNLTLSNSLTGTGYQCRGGTTGGYAANFFNIFYNAGVSYLFIDTTNAGAFAFTSDYRIKKDVIDLPGMWDTVKALRPIKYTQAQFSPPSHVKFVAEETLKARKEAEENFEAKPREVNTAPLFPSDDIERWGFIAHELQATLTPSAATGEKDSPDTIQSPNPFTLIAALTKALQEAMARIEALEAAP